MADQTSNYRDLRKQFFTSTTKEAVKELPHVPSKAEWISAFTALDDDVTSRFTSAWKPGLETELGVTLTNAQAKKIVAAYFYVKLAELRL